MEKELTEYLRKITQASYSQVELRLAKYGLVKGQAHLLMVIKENNGCTQKELAEQFGVRYSSMCERINKLENMGYVTRSIDENNSKFKRIFITSEGKIAGTQCKRIINEFNSVLYAGFTKKDIKQLEKYMDKLIENIE